MTAVYEVVRRLIFEEEESLYRIEFYAARNTAFHSGLNRIIHKKRDYRLAATIAQDLEYLNIAFKETASEIASWDSKAYDAIGRLAYYMCLSTIKQIPMV